MVVKNSPVTGENVGTFSVGGAEQVAQAVGRARAAAPAWSALTVAERIGQLDRFGRLVSDRMDSIVDVITADTGKPRVEAVMTELLSVPLFLQYFRENAAKVLGRRRVGLPLVFQPRRAWVDSFPMGVVAVISPWNFPFQLAVIPVLTALVAGNTVVLKPSEVTPRVSLLISELFRLAALPEGVVEVVHGDGSTGAALCDADIDKIFFTGSVATGRKVMAAAARRPIPVELELGGKDAMIVCADAPIERAVRGALWGGLVNAGQACVSVERILVVDAIHDAFVEALKREVERLRSGGPDEQADIGPMASPPQLGVVERHVRQAVDAGARVLTGGHRIDRPGDFYAPTLLVDVDETMDIYRDETFGPVLPVMRVRDEDHAVELANRHQYGLTASVWTRDSARGIALASRIHAGQVLVNDVISSVGNPVLPFGGVKASGIGRYHGPEGLLSFVHTRAILSAPTWFDGEPWWYPYAGKYEPAVDLFRHLASGRLSRAVGSLARMARQGRTNETP
jgi:acyl-CoA reductase-like NAD-dependent aldehyde dehydrogenase